MEINEVDNIHCKIVAKTCDTFGLQSTGSHYSALFLGGGNTQYTGSSSILNQ